MSLQKQLSFDSSRGTNIQVPENGGDVMRFAKHLFISYAHIDNQPITPEQQGWITRFHASLEALLSMRMGGKAQIWRDEKLQGNDIFADEILDQFAQTAVLVSVLTPRYLNSEWCNKEVAEFWRDNYDLSYILKRDWAVLGPKVRGKLHFAVGMMDNYYLNEAVYLAQEFLDSATNPPSGATFQYGFRGRHSWIGHSPVEPERQITYAEFVSVISDYISQHAPAGSDTKSWKY